MTHQPPASSGTPTLVLICLAGPDHGKRLALSASDLTVGRGANCNLASDDPDVTERFAVLRLEGARLRVFALAEPPPFVDGHPVTDGVLDPGQQLRMGRSTWQYGVTAGANPVFGFVNRLGDHLSTAAGVERPEDWNAREMFGDVTKPRTDDEMEAYFTVGTATTTPPLAAISTQWPRPWMFARVFLLTLVLYIGFVWALSEFNNPNLIPGLIMIGSVAVPFSLLIFFFEVNTPRNVSLFQVIKLLLIGGLVSIVVSLFGFRYTGLDSWLGAAAAGIIEESGKALTLLLVVRKMRFRWTLNGLLLGATVGAGFAIFESAGYALTSAVDNFDAMRHTIVERGFLSVLGGHVLWTGLVGAALWRVRGNEPFRREMLIDPRFLRVFGICVLMHMTWNWSELSLPMYGKYFILGCAAWLLVLGFIQNGLKQVREAQAREAVAPGPA